MIAERQQCLDRTTLADLLSGKLPTERFATAMKHVDACEHCRQIAEEQSSAGDAWLVEAAQAKTSGEFDGESQCQAIVGQLLVDTPSQVANPKTATSDDTVPRKLLGPYRLLRRVGAGGMGAVYLAEHQRLQKQVAIKLLPRDKLIQSGWLERFNREMTSVAALEHPHIVRALDAGDEDNWHYLVMEYLDGLDLARVCRRIPEISIGAACELIRQAALGLSAIHASGMIHRDIKPSNLFLTQSGVLKLLDLGLVLDGQSPLATDERLTTVGHLMGTLPYMPREQLSDARAIDHRADIYSLGATLHRMLVGRPPFNADSLPRTVQAISSSDCQPVATHRDDLPPELCGLVDSMLSHDIDQRPQSAEAVAAALAPLCDEHAARQLIQTALRCEPASDELPSQYSQVDFPQPASSRPPRSRWPALAVALALPIFFLAGIMLTITTDRGSLTIESDTPGVTVKVMQGDKLVESLVVEQSPSEPLRLHSGRYTIELEGVESGRLVISDTEIAITRGDEQIVRIARTLERSEGGGDSGKLFQGKALSHWMDTLVRDQDNETLGLAMQAVVLLAETDEEKLLAAKQLLAPARRLGGVVSGSRFKETSDPSSGVSEWFMTDLLQWYPTLFPRAGVEAIVDELESGTERSFFACAFLLKNFSTPRGFMAAPAAPQYYPTLAQSEDGNKLLHRLNQGLQKWVSTSRDAIAAARPLSITASTLGVAEHLAMGHRILVMRALSEPLGDDPQIVDWAQRKLAAATKILESDEAKFGGEWGVGYGVSPLDATTALTIYQVLGDSPQAIAPVVLGLFQDYSNGEDSEIEQAFQSLAFQHPSETAQALQLLFDRASGSGGFSGGGMGGMMSMNMGSGGGMVMFPPQTALAARALSVMTAHHPSPMAAILSLTRALHENRIPAGFDRELILSGADELLERIVLETDLESDPDASAKLAYAVRGLALRTKATDAVLEVLLRRLRDFEVDGGAISGGPDWPYEADTKFDDQTKSSYWTTHTYFNYLQMLIAGVPSQAIPALARELREGTSHSAVFCDVLTPSLGSVRNDPAGARLPELLNEQRRGLREFVNSEQGKRALLDLARSLGVAFERLSKDETLDFDTRLLTKVRPEALLLGRQIEIYKAIEKENDDEALVSSRLREFVASESRRPHAEFFKTRLSIYLLDALADMDGIAQVPLDAILRLAWSTQELTPDAQRLVDRVYESRPDEFRQFFEEALLNASTKHMLGLANVFRSRLDLDGRQRETKGVWHAIVKHMLTGPEEAQTQASIERLIREAGRDASFMKPLRSLLE